MLVIFRKTDKGPIAIFPLEPGDPNGNLCLCETPAGIVSGTVYSPTMKSTRPANKKEYREFLKMLRKKYGELRLVQQATPEMHEARIAAAKKLHKQDEEDKVES